MRRRAKLFTRLQVAAAATCTAQSVVDMLTLVEPMVSYFEGRIARGELGVSALRTQRNAIRGFVLSFGARPITQLGKPAVLHWLEGLTKFAQSTRRMHVSAVRGWFRYLHEDYGLPDMRPHLPRVKVPRQVPRAMGRPDVVRLLTALPDTRARAIVGLELYLGLRAVEVSRMNIEDYDGDSLFIRGKGGHERVLPVGGPCRQVLDAWMYERGTAAGPMFPGQDGTEGLKPATVSNYMGAWMRAAGVKRKPYDGRSGHTLRHTAATDALRSGVDVRTVQAMLGHANLSSTSWYLRPGDRPDMLKAVERDYLGSV